MSNSLGDKLWCCEGHFSLADVAVGSALGWLEFRFPEITWRTDYANLARLMDALMQRPSFADTAPR
jgi:glutathione S-transferase